MVRHWRNVPDRQVFDVRLVLISIFSVFLTFQLLDTCYRFEALCREPIAGVIFCVLRLSHLFSLFH
jgi:hypothetical protein